MDPGPAAELQAIPFVPGRARGRLHTEPARAAGGGVLLARHEDLHRLHGRPAGLIVTRPAPFSHIMIGVLAAGIPTVLCTECGDLRAGQCVEIDGASGRVRFLHAPCASVQEAASGPPAAPRPLYTNDGTPVELRASVRSAAQARRAVARGAAAIGLVRSEFLLGTTRTPPARCEDWLRPLRALCGAAAPVEVWVRLLDVAADKRPPWMQGLDAGGGPLGLQGVRLFEQAAVRQVVDAQLQALRLLADEYRIGVILPFVSSGTEFAAWRRYVERRLGGGVAVVAMAEHLAVVLDLLAPPAGRQPVSVGCNDLMQTFFAADRDRPELARYLDPYAPALFRFLDAFPTGRREDVQLCGLLSQLHGVLPVLLGLGFRRFSVDAVSIPWLAQSVRGLRLTEAERLAERVLTASDTRRVRDLLGVPAWLDPPGVPGVRAIRTLPPGRSGTPG